MNRKLINLGSCWYYLLLLVMWTSALQQGARRGAAWNRFQSKPRLTRGGKSSLFTQRDDYAFFDQLSPKNVEWKSYRYAKNMRSIDIAEVADIDEAFDHAIESGGTEPFGIVSWDSSRIALEILDNHYCSAEVDGLPMKGMTVCDLGCGTGLCSLLTASLGARVIALDHNPLSLKLAELSYQRYCAEQSGDNRNNGDCYGTVEFRSFDAEDRSTNLPSCDLLIVSDLLYYDSLAVAIANQSLKVLESEEQCSILITDPGRGTARTFVAELKRIVTGSHILGSGRKNEIIEDIRFHEHTGEAQKRGYYMWLK